MVCKAKMRTTLYAISIVSQPLYVQSGETNFC